MTEWREAIREQLDEVPHQARRVAVVVGLGGVIGSGLAPLLTRQLRQVGFRVHAFGTLPFPFEGAQRAAMARQALDVLSEAAEEITILDNSTLPEDARGRTLADLLSVGNDRVAAGVPDFLNG